MYAPFGTGALVAGRSCIGARPSHPGGGTVRAVTLDDVVWADLPDREESGSPNVVGAVALAAAIEALTAIGMDRLARHEADLTAYATARLAAVPGLTLHGPAGADRVGVIALSVAGRPHALVAAVLADEHGVGVRSGCFCAHPYIAHLLRLDRSATCGVGRPRRGRGPARRPRAGPPQPGLLQRPRRRRSRRGRAARTSPMARSGASTSSRPTARSPPPPDPGTGTSPVEGGASTPSRCLLARWYPTAADVDRVHHAQQVTTAHQEAPRVGGGGNPPRGIGSLRRRRRRRHPPTPRPRRPRPTSRPPSPRDDR